MPFIVPSLSTKVERNPEQYGSSCGITSSGRNFRRSPPASHDDAAAFGIKREDHILAANTLAQFAEKIVTRFPRRGMRRCPR